MELELWEILVPTVRNDGTPIRTRFHRVWDAKVRELAGGLTITKPVQGQWVDASENQLYKERMIPVRVAIPGVLVQDLISITMKHYEDQKAIMCYKVSDEVIIEYRL